MKKRLTKSGQEGYILLVLMLAVTLILIALTVEAPRIAQQIKREREEELVHRGKEYATAVKRFVHKNGGRYPLSLDQLENTNHIRFLRKRFKDPVTGEDNWKLIHIGEAQIVIPAANPGLQGSGNPGLTGSTTGTGTPGQQPTGTAPLINTGGGQLGQAQPPAGGRGQLGSLQTTNIGNGQTVGGGQMMGVASVSKGKAIKEFNDKDHYDEWYFVYDLRLEQAGGTGVAVAAPRGEGAPPPAGQGPAQPLSPTGGPVPTGTPAPTPPPLPQ